MDSTKRCEQCGLERRWLHTHHVIPRSQGGSNEPGNLLHICVNCHEDIHGGPFGGQGKNRLSLSPGAQQKRSESLKEFYAVPENRARHGEISKRNWEQRDREEAGQRSREWHASNPDANAERIRKITETKRAKAAADRAARWSQVADACVECGTTERPHSGRGICERCHSRIKARERRAAQKAAKT